jgi:hypothetical protein
MTHMKKKRLWHHPVKLRKEGVAKLSVRLPRCLHRGPLGFSRNWEIYRDEQGGPALGERRKAGMRMHTGLIAVSFHRLFLGGLLPSRARFCFAGYCHGIRRDWVPSSLQRSDVSANPHQG